MLAGLLLYGWRLYMILEVMEASELLAYWDRQDSILIGAPMKVYEEVGSVGYDEGNREVNSELPTPSVT